MNRWWRWGLAWGGGGAAILVLAPVPGPLLILVSVLALVGALLERPGASSVTPGVLAGVFGGAAGAVLLYTMAFPREIWLAWLEDVAQGGGRGALGAGVAGLLALILLLLAAVCRGRTVRFGLGLALVACALGLFLFPGPFTAAAAGLTLVLWSGTEALNGLRFHHPVRAWVRWAVLWLILGGLALGPFVLFPPDLTSWRTFQPLPDYGGLLRRWVPDLDLPLPWPGSGSTSGARTLGDPPHRTHDPLFLVQGAPFEDLYLIQAVYEDYRGTSWAPRLEAKEPGSELTVPSGGSFELTVQVRSDYLLTGPFPEGYARGVRRSFSTAPQGQRTPDGLPWVLGTAARRGEVFAFQRLGEGRRPTPPTPQDLQVPAALAPVLEPWVAPWKGRSRNQVLAGLAAALQKRCSYTLKPPPIPEGEDFVGTFLDSSRQGFCEHFASAAVLLARSAGLPARYVTGWRARADARGALLVDGFAAHAWAEVWDEQAGWQVWETTPAPVFSSAPPYSVSAGDESGAPGAETSGPRTVSADPSAGSFWGALGAGAALWVAGGLVGIGAWRRFRHRGRRGFGRWLARWSRQTGSAGPEAAGWEAWGRTLEGLDPSLRGKGRRWARLWERHLWAGAPWRVRDEAFHRAMLRRVSTPVS